MKVLVTGGRDFEDAGYLRHVLQMLHVANRPVFPEPWHMSPFTHLIHGGAKGADSIADEWAKGNGVQTVKCEANWDKFGKKAGVLRNLWMLDLLDPTTDIAVVMPGNRGTQDMVNRLVENGINVHISWVNEDHANRIEQMLRIARGEVRDENAEEAEAPIGEAVPEANAPNGNLPNGLGLRVLGAGTGFGIGGGGGQAQEVGPGGLRVDNAGPVLVGNWVIGGPPAV